MDDGSGLSPLNRVTPRAVVGLLSYMAASPFWEPYWESLPEAGARDGLRRMYKTGAERNLRAKTGTINRVSALSGYVRAANGERLAFSIISNAVPSTWRAKRVEDAIGARLAAFQRPVSEGAATVAQAPPAGRLRCHRRQTRRRCRTRWRRRPREGRWGRTWGCTWSVRAKR